MNMHEKLEQQLMALPAAYEAIGLTREEIRQLLEEYKAQSNKTEG